MYPKKHCKFIRRLLIFYLQKFRGKLYLCEAYHTHQVSSGSAADRDHTCEDISLPTAILNYLAKHPQDWNRLPWACLYCGRENSGVDMLCTRSECRDEAGSSRSYVMGNLLTKLGEELALMPVVEDAAPEIWPVPTALEVLLSPA